MGRLKTRFAISVFKAVCWLSEPVHGLTSHVLRWDSEPARSKLLFVRIHHPLVLPSPGIDGVWKWSGQSRSKHRNKVKVQKQYAQVDSQYTANYFTSSDPHHDIPRGKKRLALEREKSLVPCSRLRSVKRENICKIKDKTYHTDTENTQIIPSNNHRHHKLKHKTCHKIRKNKHYVLPWPVSLHDVRSATRACLQGFWAEEPTAAGAAPALDAGFSQRVRRIPEENFNDSVSVASLTFPKPR